MSSNKDFLKFLKDIQYSSVSNINLKYNKVFKEFSIDTLVERSKFKNLIQKKWLVEEENKTKSKFITTNDKLKQIINAHKNIYQIQESFFKTFDKEPLFKRLINKENKTEKLSKKTFVSKSNVNINQKKKNKDNEKEKEKADEFYKRRNEENNRKPPLGLYNPRYSYIEKHIPSFKFHHESSNSHKTISFQNNQDNKPKENSEKKQSKNNSQIKALNHSLTPINKTKKLTDIFPFIDSNKEKSRMERYKYKLLSLDKNQENIFLSQLNYLSQNKTNLENNDKEKTLKFNYTPKIIEKNIPVPIFNKMSDRFNKDEKKGKIANSDYSPNYNAIFSNVLDNKPIDYEKRKKYYYLKKIITNYNQNVEYVLFPELNNISKK